MRRGGRAWRQGGREGGREGGRREGEGGRMVNNEKAITTMNTLLTHEEEKEWREGGEEGELVQFPPQSL